MMSEYRLQMYTACAEYTRLRLNSVLASSLEEEDCNGTRPVEQSPQQWDETGGAVAPSSSSLP